MFFCFIYSPELEVGFWEYGKYFDAADAAAPSAVIPATIIRCQVARGMIPSAYGRFWVTTAFERVMYSCLHFLFYSRPLQDAAKMGTRN
jgi:hypothetical protein